MEKFRAYRIFEENGKSRGRLVEMTLDAGEAVIVDAREAHHVGHQRPVGINALRLALELKAGHAQAVHQILLAGREVPVQPDEPPVGRKLRPHIGFVEVR